MITSSLLLVVDNSTEKFTIPLADTNATVTTAKTIMPVCRPRHGKQDKKTRGEPLGKRYDKNAIHIEII